MKALLVLFLLCIGPVGWFVLLLIIAYQVFAPRPPRIPQRYEPLAPTPQRRRVDLEPIDNPNMMRVQS